MKVGVLAGGVSEEREISLLSGKQVYKALNEKSINVKFLDIKTSDHQKIKEIIQKAGIDVAFIALHGSFGEDGKVQAILEEIPLTYTGSGPKASALAMNKVAAKEKFNNSNIPTPSSLLFSAKNYNYNKIQCPVVIKPCFSGSSFGVSIVSKNKDIGKSLAEAFKFSKLAMAEDYIEGKELTVGILEEKPLAIVEIIPKEGYFDFNNKYIKGKSDFIAPAKLDKDLYWRIQQVALKAHKALGCRDFSRVDIRLKGDVPYVLEVNSIPGFTRQSLLPFSASVCGIDFYQLIITFLKSALARKKCNMKIKS
ncbi:D-alanine--D-alanine ligase [Candidatus Babeliales bacterium]|nr:D-alanine--D-alanine ligase [Candidatus Babeliales bacterium]